MKELSIITFPFIPPEQIFNLLKNNSHFIWLDSCLNNRRDYSLMACNPFLLFKSKKKKISIRKNGMEKLYEGQPLNVLHELMEEYRIPPTSFFAPGALGYFSYDLGCQIETLPDISTDDLNIPDIYLGFYEMVILFDHKRKNIRLISMDVRGSKQREFESLSRNLAAQLKTISLQKEKMEEVSFTIDKISSNITYREYIKAVKKIKSYIAAGDVYQINFSRRIEAEGVFPADRLYLKLRKVNPTSFSGFFDTGDFCILSNSPELFIKKKGCMITSLPMKGTRPRGKNKKEDNRYASQLLLSEKDKAELIMIVDLERNDMGKVCKYGSIRVENIRNLEKYRTVFQTTSLIKGRLTKGLGQVDLLKAVFPGGSITGAPKIRAMEIIEDIEPNKRAFYTGSMGYLGFNGNMELNILIRTLLLKGRHLYYPVGGGIVWDSVPDEEFEETQTKAKALFLALGYESEKFISF